MLPFPFSRFPAFSLFALFFPLRPCAASSLRITFYGITCRPAGAFVSGVIPRFYKHVAPLGLNASVPVFSFSRLLSFRSLFSFASLRYIFFTYYVLTIIYPRDFQIQAAGHVGRVPQPADRPSDRRQQPRRRRRLPLPQRRLPRAGRV